MKNYKKALVYVGEELYNEYILQDNTNNKIEYKDDSCTNTIELIEDNLTIIRENEEFTLNMESKKDYALYLLKELNYELDIKINYLDYFKEEKDLIIAYQLETNDKEIRIILKGE